MKRVLIADDLRDQRALYTTPLVLAGFVVEEAADGGQVMDIVASQPPDVIVLDLAMPVLDGLEVCRRLKADARTAAIPIIVLTGNTLPGVRETVERAGADAFLTRPCSLATLMAAIRRHTGEPPAALSGDDEPRSEPYPRAQVSTLRRVPGRLEDGVAPVQRPRRRYRPWLYALAAAVVLAFGLTLGLGPMATMQRANRLNEVARAAVDEHRKLTRRLAPLAVAGISPRAAEDWFRRCVDFNVVLPNLKNPRVSLVGGRMSRLANADAAAIEYQLDQHLVSVFIIGEQAYNRLALAESPMFKLIRQGRYDVIIWRHGTTGYAIVSEIGARACHVCHSPDEKFDGASLESLVVRL